MAELAQASTADPHIPVLLRPLLDECAPIAGHWVDGTLGAGGYTRGLLDAGADHVTAIDRDPLAHELAQKWADDYPDRLSLWPISCIFSAKNAHPGELPGQLWPAEKRRQSKQPVSLRRLSKGVCRDQNPAKAIRQPEASRPFGLR